MSRVPPRHVVKLRVGPEVLKEAERLAKLMDVSQAEVLRRALSIGIPQVEERWREPRA